MATIKVIITSKNNLKAKYGDSFTTIEKLLSDLVSSDITRNIETKIIYVDDYASASSAGITATTTLTVRSAKRAVDSIYKKWNPEYIVIFGSQDIFPFQELINPVYKPDEDDDHIVPSDLPYACDKAYSNSISYFTGPTRVVGRIPDIPGVPDIEYLKSVFDAIINNKQVKSEMLMQYFAITAEVWKQSTELSLKNMFGNNSNLKNSPTAITPHSSADLKQLIHFYNCHGSPSDSKFYGQKGMSYPTAQHSPDIDSKISKGTIIAAECCYGAELYDPKDESNNNLSMVNMYFKNKAVAFLGSSTIAYGPQSGNDLADLITQYFIKNVITGASTGRALLEARQKYLSVSGPHLNPYVLKTVAQFHLMGDPSIHVASKEQSKSSAETIKNRRLKLFNKGLNLALTNVASIKVRRPIRKALDNETSEINNVFELTGFTGREDQMLFQLESKNRKVELFTKSFSKKQRITYRVFVKKYEKVKDFNFFDVLVLKESGNELLSWKLYHRK